VPKKKLIHFQENLTFPFLFQYRFHELANFPFKGEWNTKFFRNQNPIILELGCGKGEYTVGLAKAYPQKNFIGIDLKGARLWAGCRQVRDEAMTNVAFIRSLVDHLEHFFGTAEVDEIWITFPDPQPGKERKRLTSVRFITRYARIMKPGGIIHLKTDSIEFFRFTLNEIHANGHRLLYHTSDLYTSGNSDDVTLFRTHYEKIWLAMEKKICYVRFMLNDKLQNTL
jgi:tRNA (guanine-N7-)-methyltransferase